MSGTIDAIECRIGDLEYRRRGIKGKLILPSTERNCPIVLLIAGSGPTDMDGNSPLLHGKNNLLKYLAEGLAENGIASLRFDKRGIATSAAAEKRNPYCVLKIM